MILCGSVAGPSPPAPLPVLRGEGSCSSPCVDLSTSLSPRAGRGSEGEGHFVRRLALALCLALAPLTAAVAQQATPTLPSSATAGFQRSVAHARDTVLPHVVSILVVREDFNQSEAALSLSGGSGTVISAAGDVLTNAHVTENGRRFRVVMNDGREFAARLRGEDPISDLAVLRIEAPAGVVFGFARFAPTVDLKPGETVLAMGAPWGMRDSVSAGVVNNANRLMVSLFEDEADYEQSLGAEQATARYYAWIQHDAAINPGNSGGPLVDLDGRIVGVNTRGNLFGGDMAFSIPAPVAESVAKALIAHGTVPRSDFGFSVRSLRGTGFTQGALVNSVDRESNAEQAGLRAGDRILRLDGIPVRLLEPEDVPAFRRALSERVQGSTIAVEIDREGKEQTLRFASVQQAEQRAPQTEFAELGFSASDLTIAAMRARYLDQPKGALVQGIRPGGPAATAQPPLSVGDLVLAVGTHAVDSVAALKALDITSDQWTPVRFDRRGQQLLSLLRPAPKRLIPENLNELPKAWAGWDVQPITGPMAQGLGLPGPGFRLTRVYPDGPAAQAGLKVGDLLTALDGVEVKPSGIKETNALDLRVRNASVQEQTPLTLWRAGEVLERAIRLVEQPRTVDQSERRWNAVLNLTARELTLYDRVERNLAKSQQGIVIERVENGGYGGLAHLKEADLLVRVDGREVRTLDDLERALELAATAKRPKLSLLVMRGVDTRLLFVDPPWLEAR